jgi:hypothetical protein
MKFYETQLKNGFLEPKTRKSLKELLKDNELKDCCFKGRNVDAFIFGVTRAVSNNRLPIELSKGSIDVIPFKKLEKEKDQALIGKLPLEKIELILKIIAYYHYSTISKGDKDKELISHHILIDKTKWVEVAEMYFKGGWNRPEGDSFESLIESSFSIDDKILNELGI